MEEYDVVSFITGVPTLIGPSFAEGTTGEVTLQILVPIVMMFMGPIGGVRPQEGQMWPRR